MVQKKTKRVKRKQKVADALPLSCNAGGNEAKSELVIVVTVFATSKLMSMSPAPDNRKSPKLPAAVFQTVA